VLGLIVILALGAVGLVYAVGIYNGLVGLRDGVKSAWADIDVLLNQRHDELPELIESCKRYMQFEQETFARVLRARGAISQASATGNVAAVSAGEQQLRAGMGRLFAVAESYPQLKSDESFQQLRSRIIGIEAAIADRCELYNEQVNLNNIRVSVLPDAMLARWFGFKPAHSLDFLGDERRDVDVGAPFRA
jgi:LemA protein